MSGARGMFAPDHRAAADELDAALADLAQSASSTDGAMEWEYLVLTCTRV